VDCYRTAFGDWLRDALNRLRDDLPRSHAQAGVLVHSATGWHPPPLDDALESANKRGQQGRWCHQHSGVAEEGERAGESVTETGMGGTRGGGGEVSIILPANYKAYVAAAAKTHSYTPSTEVGVPWIHIT
jgi:hypothetical protein